MVNVYQNVFEKFIITKQYKTIQSSIQRNINNKVHYLPAPSETGTSVWKQTLKKAIAIATTQQQKYYQRCNRDHNKNGSAKKN